MLGGKLLAQWQNCKNSMMRSYVVLQMILVMLFKPVRCNVTRAMGSVVVEAIEADETVSNNCEEV